MLIELNNASHNLAVVLKAAMPGGVREHHVGSAVGAAFIGGMVETAKKRLNAERVEIVAAHFIAEDPGWGFARIDARLRDSLGGQALEAVVAVAQVEIVGIRLHRK